MNGHWKKVYAQKFTILTLLQLTMGYKDLFGIGWLKPKIILVGARIRHFGLRQTKLLLITQSRGCSLINSGDFILKVVE